MWLQVELVQALGVDCFLNLVNSNLAALEYRLSGRRGIRCAENI